MINGRRITMMALVPEPTESDTFTSRQKQVERMFQQKEEQSYNNSMELENKLMTIIQTGNVEGIRNFVHAAPRYQAGVVANTPIRLQKNYFIATITLATRAAILGGLSAEQAFRLSDIYIAKAESLSDLQSIQTLYLQSLTDLTMQVNATLQAQRQLTVRNTNQMIQNCMDYVQKHTHSALTVQQVADALGYHRSYLSMAFTKATGTHLNDYIYRCKLEESCHLLRYTTKRISEISDALCFSNQSHYVKRFKSLYNMTPAEYRMNHAK
jgi:YesN/AraC family two-component response regulator